MVKQRETAAYAGTREVVDIQPGLYADVAWHELDATGFTRANFELVAWRIMDIIKGRQCLYTRTSVEISRCALNSHDNHLRPLASPDASKVLDHTQTPISHMMRGTGPPVMPSIPLPCSSLQEQRTR